MVNNYKVINLFVLFVGIIFVDEVKDDDEEDEVLLEFVVGV